MTTHSNGMSARQLEDQLGVTYKTAWLQNPHHRGRRGHRSRYQSGQATTKHAKYLDTRSGRIRLAMITGNSAASIEAFVKANVKRSHTVDRRARILSGIDRLSARSTHRRQDGRTRCLALDLPGSFADEEMEPRHISRPAPQARRHISQRIRLSLQSPLLPACFIRNIAGLPPPRARELLGHHKTGQSPQGCGTADPTTYRRT